MTDKVVVGLDIFGVVRKALEDSGVSYYIYSGVDENPTDYQVEKGAEVYKFVRVPEETGVPDGLIVDSEGFI